MHWHELSLYRIQMCTVERFECKNVREKARVAEIIEIAESQGHAFRGIYPEEADCMTEDNILFVAMKGDILCGVMVTNLNLAEEALVVDMLTSRATTDAGYKGVGTMLMRAAEAEAKKRGFKHVMVYPLPSATSFYTKIGYVPLKGWDGYLHRHV